MDYLYDPSERLHTKYYRQINLSPRDISSLFYLFSGVDKSERNFANIFRLFSYFATTVKFIVNLQTGHTQCFLSENLLLSHRNVGGQNNFPKISLTIDVSFYLMFLITYFTYQFYQKNAQNMHYYLYKFYVLYL